MARRRALIESDGPFEGPGSEGPRHRWSLFLELMRFAEGGSCRHDAVLRYFGDEEETLAGCGRCDVCEVLGSEESPAESEEEVTLLVRKALSGVARIHGRFGLGAAVALLRGQDDPRLRGAGLDQTTTWGILGDRAEIWLTKVLRRCVTAGWVDFWGGDRPVAILTEAGMAVMRGERGVRLLLPPEKTGLPRARGAPGADRGPGFVVRRKGESASRDSRGATRGATQGTTRGGDAEILALDAKALLRFEALRAFRLETAQRDGVPPYVVATDRSLRELAVLDPTRLEDLTLAHGIGEAKAEKYGEDFLRVLKSASGETTQD